MYGQVQFESLIESLTRCEISFKIIAMSYDHTISRHLPHDVVLNHSPQMSFSIQLCLRGNVVTTAFSNKLIIQTKKYTEHNPFPVRLSCLNMYEYDGFCYKGLIKTRRAQPTPELAICPLRLAIFVCRTARFCEWSLYQMPHLS
jgi:hypothetical protein